MLAVFFLVIAGLHQCQPETLVDHFDLVEVNHVHDKFGFPVFDQVVFRNWHTSTHGFRVEAWAFMRDSRVFTAEGQAAFDKALNAAADRMSIRDAMELRHSVRYRGDYEGGRMHPKKFGGRYITVFRQDEWKREVHTKWMIETWTQYDVELADKKHLDESDRKGFRVTGEGVFEAPATRN